MNTEKKDLIQTYFPQATFSNDDYKEWCNEKLEKAPDYFWTTPASPSLKFHKENGQTISLVNHVKKVLQIHNKLHFVFALTEEERDICTTAILLHDLAKCGLPGRVTYRDDNNNPKTDIMHPYLVKELLGVDKKRDGFLHYTNTVKKETIFKIIEGHMGIFSIIKASYPFQRNHEKRNKEISLNRLDQLIIHVHMCDAMASQNGFCIEDEK